MPSALVRALHERHRLPALDAASIDAALDPPQGAPAHALLFFTGDPAQRGESDDVAVVLPQLLHAFRGSLRGAVIARGAEEALKGRFGVVVMPSLALVRRAETLAVFAKIRDWSEYVARIGACLAEEAPALKPGVRPKTEIRVLGQRVAQ